MFFKNVVTFFLSGLSEKTKSWYIHKGYWIEDKAGVLHKVKRVEYDDALEFLVVQTDGGRQIFINQIQKSFIKGDYHVTKTKKKDQRNIFREDGQNSGAGT